MERLPIIALSVCLEKGKKKEEVIFDLSLHFQSCVDKSAVE